MRKLTCILIITMAILAVPALAQEHGFFFGTGLSARFLDGDAYYKLTVTPPPLVGVDPNPYEITGNFDMTDNSGYFLSSKSFLGLRPTIGYRFGDRFELSASYDLLYSIDGNRAPWAYRPSSGASAPAPIDSSYYSQQTLQVLALYYPGIWHLFVAAGVEYNTMHLDLTYHTVSRGDLGPDFIRHSYEDDDHVWGWVIGIGTERSIKKSLTLVGMTTYSFARYTGDGMYFGNLMDEYELDVGGLSAHLGVRYYVW